MPPPARGSCEKVPLDMKRPQNFLFYNLGKQSAVIFELIMFLVLSLKDMVGFLCFSLHLVKHLAKVAAAVDLSDIHAWLEIGRSF
jgi:uncharacterized membrane protein